MWRQEFRKSYILSYSSTRSSVNNFTFSTKSFVNSYTLKSSTKSSVNSYTLSSSTKSFVNSYTLSSSTKSSVIVLPWVVVPRVL